MAAIIVAFVVVLLSTAAIAQSVNSISQSAIANKQVSSTDAAEAGIQFEINRIMATSNGSVTCPSLSALGNASYQLSYSLTGSAPLTLCAGQTVTLPAGGNVLLQSTGTTTFASVFGSQTDQALVTIPGTKTSSYTAGGFSAAIYGVSSVADSGGFAVYDANNGARTYTQGTVSCTSGDQYQGDFLAYSTAPSSSDGGCNILGNLYAKGGVSLTQGAQIGGSVYTPGTFAFSSGGNVGGSVYAVGDATITNGNILGALTSGGNVSWGAGNYSASGPIYAAGNVTISNGTVGNVYAGGTVNYTTGNTQAGTIYASGSVTVSNGTVSNIVSGGTVTISGGARVTGTIYASGGVNVSGAFVNNVVSGGSVTVTGYNVGGTIYAASGILVTGGSVQVTETSGGNITFGVYLSGGAAYVASRAQLIFPCPGVFLGGPSSCNYSLPGSYPVAPSFTSSIPSPTSVAATVTAAEPAAPTFPTLNFDKNAWLQDPNFGPNTVFIIPSASQQQDECNVANPAPGLSYQADPNNIWTTFYNDVETRPAAGATASPVVLVMPTTAVSGGGSPCAFTWGDDYRKQFNQGNGLTLYANLAIISPYGINMGSWMGGNGVTSGDGNAHDLYLIVPSNAPAVPSGVTGSSCGGSSTGGDIQLGTSLSGSSVNIKDFVYTPNNVCASATVGWPWAPGILGKVYAGGSFTAPSAYYQRYDSSLSPYIAGSGGGGSSTGSTPTVQYIKKVANPSGYN